MRAIGTSKVLSWRWAPCLGLAVGACGFAAFAMLAIPDRIGSGAEPSPGSAAFRLESGLASTQSGTDSSSRFSSSDSSSTSATFSSLPSNQASRSAGNMYPKRGFTPPLERPAPPPAPPPNVPQQPALEMPPPQAAVPAPPPPTPPALDQQAAAASLEDGARNPD